VERALSPPRVEANAEALEAGLDAGADVLGGPSADDEAGIGVGSRLGKELRWQLGG
jgi:hypothetical protein